MNIAEAKSHYLDTGKFFDPEDHEVLASFCKANPTLSNEQIFYLSKLLALPNNDWRPKYFVADLLYYYRSAAESLLSPLLQAAIEIGDPSYNRVFLRPSLAIYGDQVVVDSLDETFRIGGITDRIGVSLLLYWLRIYDVDISLLYKTIEEATKSTHNLIELYHYKLALPHHKSRFPDIPDDAAILQIRINGNTEYEHILYEKLGWKRLNVQ